jgi:protein Tex
MNLLERFHQQTSIPKNVIQRTLDLLDAGNTIPFLARYRKEMTGGMDEVVLEQLRDEADADRKLEDRKTKILASLLELGVLTNTLKAQVNACSLLTDLEDLYLPYKPKRKTRASAAKEKGLEPLAIEIYDQRSMDVNRRASQFLNKDVKDVDEALQGARDIMAEWINEDKRVRDFLRQQFSRFAVLKSKLKKGKEEEGIKFSDYFSYEQQLNRMPSHRFLAVLRGEETGILSISVAPDEEKTMSQLERIVIRGQGAASDQVQLALNDGYKRLLQPSLESETLKEAKLNADEAAVKIFASNLRQLLMTAPLGDKRILAIDPGFRSGCKLVCLDEQGKFLYNETVYPHAPQGQEKQAMAKLSSLIEMYKIDAVAIGNGTAGRETEQLIQRMHLPANLQVYVVSESGASIYSASPIARKEFPQYDVTVRGAISIGRRLQDPLSELVKIDPKSVGVGQYQHDVDQALLSSRLDNVVISCVNQVGVDLNVSGAPLLQYVAGLGPSLADTIVNYRNANGPFSERSDLLKVPRLGKKAFEQCAGFLRISNGNNPLDNSGVHPERYGLVVKIAKDLKLKTADLIGMKDLRSKLDLNKYVSDDLGLPTLNDILDELEKPARDPRKKSKIIQFDSSVRKPEDLIVGMVLQGIVTNITAFGAFVDVGVKQDGLVHVSEMADQFVKDPMEFVQLHQAVQVRVKEVDLLRKRIAFSMKNLDQQKNS